MKGIVLAGGSGTRLHPITRGVSKQMLPVYDKPMIYYPLSTLMHSGIKEILIITNEKDKTLFQSLLGDGKKLGISIEDKTQKKPDGIAQAFLIGDEFIKDKPVTLILGDNIFYGKGLVNLLQNANNNSNATIFAYPVKDPERYGVVEFSSTGNVVGIEEKPNSPKSNFAITGIYYYDNSVISKAKSLKPSKRGELEITDINKRYLAEKNLKARTKEVEECKVIIKHQIEEYIQYEKQRELERAMKSVPARIKGIREKAFSEVFAKEIDNLDPNARKIVDDVIDYMEKKYISVPMKMAKEILLKESVK